MVPKNIELEFKKQSSYVDKLIHGKGIPMSVKQKEIDKLTKLRNQYNRIKSNELPFGH